MKRFCFPHSHLHLIKTVFVKSIAMVIEVLYWKKKLLKCQLSMSHLYNSLIMSPSYHSNLFFFHHSWIETSISFTLNFAVVALNNRFYNELQWLLLMWLVIVHFSFSKGSVMSRLYLWQTDPVFKFLSNGWVNDLNPRLEGFVHLTSFS